jgi:hypothetical protein
MVMLMNMQHGAHCGDAKEDEGEQDAVMCGTDSLAFGCRCGRSDRILVCSLVRTKKRPVLACTHPGLSRWHTARAGSQAFLSSSCRCLHSHTNTRDVVHEVRGRGGRETMVSHDTHTPIYIHRTSHVARTHTHINQSHMHAHTNTSWP